MLVRMAATSYVGLQRFCRMSRQSSPVPYTLGWNIWLINFTPGGLLGYCSSKFMTRRNVPSSNGVSAGPMMTAFLIFYQKCCSTLPGHVLEYMYHVITLSATGDAETPAGGSVCMRCEHGNVSGGAINLNSISLRQMQYIEEHNTESEFKFK